LQIGFAYWLSFSGPLLDRIATAQPHPRVQAASNTQLARFWKLKSSNIVANADMSVGEIRQFCKLQDEGQHSMRAAMTQLNLSACIYHRTRSVKLARIIADLAGCEEIQSVYPAEALRYRPKLLLN